MLQGVRIISLCHYLQGPAAAQYLADMGADVIKVEPIGGAYERHWSGAKVFIGEVSGFYLCANKNKRSICINLKTPQGKAALLRLVASADVVMENFRPGTLDRLGLDYNALKEAKPDIIFASASGYGATGPYAHLPGQDLLIQARTGLVAATAGQTAGIAPAAVGCAAVDQHGAALMAMGILGALVRKCATGKGTRVESSLFNAGIDLQQESITNYLNGQMQPSVYQRDVHLATWFHQAPYGIYATADQRYIALSLSNLAQFDQALDLSELMTDPALDPYLDRDRIAQAIAQRLSALGLAQAQDVLTQHQIWFAPVNHYSDLAADPQVQHNQIFGQTTIDGQDAIVVHHPNRYDGEVPTLRHLAQHAGQDTAAVLAQVGFSDTQVTALVQAGAVA